jgi:hypothetical protein
MTAEPNTNDLATAALRYAADGYEIFPANPNNKAPLTVNGMKDATSDVTQIRRWWNDHPTALIACRIPEGVIVLDVDPRHGGDTTWAELERHYQPITAGRTHLSGRGDGGAHHWFRAPNGPTSIKPLRDWANKHGVGHKAGNNSWTSGIDILHHNHRYTILPPSPHPETGQPYMWDQSGTPGPMPTWLAQLITKPEEQPAPPLLRTVKDETSIADWFTDNHTWQEILEPSGWVIVSGDGDTDGSKWRHPNASAEWSATIKHGCLFVFSDNTDFDATEDGDPNGYTRFRAWATLEHAGDMSAAAYEAFVRRDGPPVDLNSLIGPPQATQGPENAVSTDDLLLAQIVDWPTFYSADHTAEDWLVQPILANGRSHAIFAPGGTGKSLLSLWLAVKIATGGTVFGNRVEPRTVLYLDYEMTAADLADRLDAMHIYDGDTLDNLKYALLPALPSADTAQGGRDINRLAELVGADVVVLDTFSRAVEGDENDADTVRSFYRWTGIHLKAAGRAFVRIDHAGKDINKGQRGSSAKNDDVDVVWQMTRTDQGMKLTAKKRRMGWVPEFVDLTMSDDPLHYDMAHRPGYPAGTREAMDLIEQLNIDPSLPVSQQGRLLREAGAKVSNQVLRAAIKCTRETLELKLETKKIAGRNQSGTERFTSEPARVRPAPARTLKNTDHAGETANRDPNGSLRRDIAVQSGARRSIRAARAEDQQTETLSEEEIAKRLSIFDDLL